MSSRFFLVFILSSILAACGGGSDGGGSNSGTNPSVVVTPPAEVTASLVGSSASAQYVPMAGVFPVGQFRLSATGDATCDRITVTQSGLHSSSPATVYLRVDGKPVEVSRNGDQIDLQSPIVLKSSTSQTIELVAAVSARQNEQYQFGIAGVSCKGLVVKGLPLTIGVLSITASVTPEVNLSWSPLVTEKPLTVVRVTNTYYSQNGIVPVRMTIEMKTISSPKTYVSGYLCLRVVGSTAKCGQPGTSNGQLINEPGGIFTFKLDEFRKSGPIGYSQYEEYEVYLQGAPIWSVGDAVELRVSGMEFQVGNASFWNDYTGFAWGVWLPKE